MPQADAEPISTYEQTLWWLIAEWVNHPAFLADDATLPAEGRLVCQLFWVSEKHLKADIKKRWADMFHERPGVTVLPGKRRAKYGRS